MYMPHTVTVFNTIRRTEDDYSTSVVGYAAILDGVFVQGSKSRKPNRSGVQKDSTVKLFIPFDAEATDAATGLPVSFVSADEFKDSPDGHWTIYPSSETADTNCFFVKGAVSSPVDYNNLRRSNPELCDILSVETLDYGSEDMQHWEVVGK